MPRRRMIDPEIWRNQKIGNLSDAGRLLFIGIFSQADDDGRMKASPAFLMATIFPYDKDKVKDDIKRLRDQCAELGLIRLYTNSREEYLDMPGWLEHQQIRKDRYTPSKLPSFEESQGMTTSGKPTGNQPTTRGRHSIGEGRGVKFSLVKTPPKGGARTKQVDPVVNEIFAEMRKALGYKEPQVCEPGSPTPGEKKEAKVRGGEALPAIEENKAMLAESRDPIPNYGKEGQAIKRMLARGFTREEILACWKGKVSQRGGEFVSMTWVNEDIGKKGAKTGVQSKPKQQRAKGPIRYIQGAEEPGAEDSEDMPGMR